MQFYRDKSKNAKEFDECNLCQVSHANYMVKVCLDAFYIQFDKSVKIIVCPMFNRGLILVRAIIIVIILIAQYLQTSKPNDKEIKVYHLDKADNDGIIEAFRFEFATAIMHAKI